MGNHETVDVAGLIESGLLAGLDSIFKGADWRQIDDIATFVAIVPANRGGTMPWTVEVRLESATAYGITAYRWQEVDDGGYHEAGPITLDRDEAVDGGYQYAADSDESEDADLDD